MGLTKAKLVEKVFELCTFTLDIKGKFQGPTAIITRSIARILVDLTQRSEGRLQIINNLSETDGQPFQNFVELVKQFWEPLDPFDRADIIKNGFKFLKQLTQGTGMMQRVLLHYPHMI